ncbi:MAG: hydrogenase maturation protease [Planctomycetes bacterium]|nr:hydrogenase maturation protease [Planctomycetota bacterium]
MAKAEIIVIGVGNPFRGDDAAGLAVIDELERIGAPAGVSLLKITEPTKMVDAFEGVRRVIIVDACVSESGEEPLWMTYDEIQEENPALVSSHTIGALQAVELFLALGNETTPQFTFVLIPIAGEQGYGEEMSARAQQAKASAVSQLLQELGV